MRGRGTGGGATEGEGETWYCIHDIVHNDYYN